MSDVSSDSNTMAGTSHTLSTSHTQFGVFTFDQARLIWDRIVLLHSVGKFEVAIDCAGTLVSQTTDILIRSILILNIGIMSCQLGHYEQAECYFDEAVALEPGLCIARFLLGTTAYKRQEYRKAMDAFTRCRMSFPDGFQTINYQGLGLDYVLHLSSVTENEVSSMLEWSQTQMAISLEVFLPRPVHTLSADLVFESPTFISMGQVLELVSADLRLSRETSLGTTDRLSSIPVEHVSEGDVNIASQDDSMNVVSAPTMDRPVTITNAKSPRGFETMTKNTSNAQIHHDHERTNTETEISGIAKPSIQHMVETVRVQSHRCACRTQEQSTGDSVVHFQSRFSGSSCSESPVDPSVAFDIPYRRKTTRRALKEMASRVLLRNRHEMSPEPSGQNTNALSRTPSVFDRVVPVTCQPTNTLETSGSVALVGRRPRAGVAQRMEARDAQGTDREGEKLLAKVLASNRLHKGIDVPVVTATLPPMVQRWSSKIGRQILKHRTSHDYISPCYHIEDDSILDEHRFIPTRCAPTPLVDTRLVRSKPSVSGKSHIAELQCHRSRGSSGGSWSDTGSPSTMSINTPPTSRFSPLRSPLGPIISSSGSSRKDSLFGASPRTGYSVLKTVDEDP